MANTNKEPFLAPMIPQGGGGTLTKILLNSKKAYFSKDSELDIYPILISQLNDLLDFHFNELDNRLSFFESLIGNFKQEKSKLGLMDSILLVSEGLLADAVQSGISGTLLGLSSGLDSSYSSIAWGRDEHG